MRIALSEYYVLFSPPSVLLIHNSREYLYTILPIQCVRSCGGHVGPDEGFGDVWDIHACVVHERGLEVSS